MIGDASLRCIVTDRASQRRLTGVAQVPLMQRHGNEPNEQGSKG